MIAVVLDMVNRQHIDIGDLTLPPSALQVSTLAIMREYVSLQVFSMFESIGSISSLDSFLVLLVMVATLGLAECHRPCPSGPD